MPVAGSALAGGHNPRVGFFLVAQLVDSALDDTLVLLVCVDEAEIVDVEEAVEDMDEEEFCRCIDFRGPDVNILLTSSVSIAAPYELPSVELHPMRLLC